MLTKKFTLHFLIIFLVVEIIIFKIFLDSGLLAGTDAIGHVGQVAYLSRSLRWLYAWRTWDLGFPENIRGLDFILVPLTLMVGNPSFATKLFVFACFILAGLAMYTLVLCRTQSHNASLIAAIIYILNNSLFIQYAEAHIFIIFSYAFAPLIFLFLDKALKTGSFKDTLNLALCLTVLITFFHPQMTYIYVFFTTFSLAVYALVPEKQGNFLLRLRKIFKVLAIGGILTFLLASFFFMPAIFGSISPYFMPGHPSTTRPLETYQYDPWLFLERIDYTNFTILLAMASATALLVTRRDRQVIFFILAGAMATFMAKGTQPPISEFFTWMYFNIPGLATFREYMRWLLMATLSYAFLVGILIARLELIVKDIKISKAVKKIRTWIQPIKILLPTGFMVAILVISSINVVLTSLSFINSTQTYTHQEKYVNALQWMGTIPGEFRVAEVSSLGYGENWITPGIVGVGYRDIFSDSYYIHDKPVLQTGGWVPEAENFFKFTQASGGWRRIGNLAELLGAFNVRYIILPPHAESRWVEVFKNQDGLYPALNYAGTLILENENWAQRVFASSRYGLVVGGRETMTSLLTIPNFNLNSYGLIFVDQNRLLFNTLAEDADSIIFSDGSYLDLIFTLLDDKYVIPLGRNLGSSNFKSDVGVEKGKLTFSNPILRLGGPVEWKLPFNIEKSDEYILWIRLAFDCQRGTLHIKLDEKMIGSLHPLGFNFKFSWVNLGTFHLERGTHTLTLSNHGATINEIDAIAIVPSQVMNLTAEKVLNSIRNFQGRIIIVKEAEDLFEGIYPLPFNASNGFATKITRSNMAEISIPKPGTYMIGLRLYAQPRMGIINFSIADKSFFKFYNIPAGENFIWLELGPTNLEVGKHRISISPTGTMVDVLVIYSLNEGEKRLGIEELFNISPPSVSFKQLNPTTYKVHVSSSQPFLLTLSYAYHPLWRAYIDGREHRSILSYTFANSFKIDKSGDLDITIYYLGQKYTEIGLVISLISLIVSILYLTFTSNLFRKFKKGLV
ncbi:TPA: hypothetical protein EYP70_03905 [Candidatus Bathyarchaeota archaeon]|nr:hypothetical protein [Candidatus Bathyarchaeota archaeon]